MNLPSLVILLLAAVAALTATAATPADPSLAAFFGKLRAGGKQADLAHLQALIPDGTHPNKNGCLEVSRPGSRTLPESANR